MLKDSASKQGWRRLLAGPRIEPGAVIVA